MDVVAALFLFPWVSRQAFVYNGDHSEALNHDGSSCTDVSFTYPGWTVEDFFMSGDNVSFRLTNNAKADTPVTCSTGRGRSTFPMNKSSCHICDNDNACFRYGQQFDVLTITETWTCDEIAYNGQNLTFVGTGNTTVGCPSETSYCRNRTAKVKGSLISPVMVTPVIPDPPRGHNTPSCIQASQSPSWRVTNFGFYAGMSPPNPLSGGSWAFDNTHFDLTNPAINDTRSCAADNALISSSKTPDGMYQCDKFPPRNQYFTETYHHFNPGSKRLDINQTWYCDDQGPGSPHEFQAHGSVILDIRDCKSNDEIWTITQVLCSDGATFNGTITSDKRLPAGTLQRPRPVNNTCTSKSMRNPSFDIGSFLFRTSWRDWDTDIPTTQVWSRLRNSVTGSEVDASYMSFHLNAKNSTVDWQGCRYGAQNEYKDLCYFTFDANQTVTVRADWNCTDVDPAHPIRFTGIAQGVPPFNATDCKGTNYGNRSDSYECWYRDRFTIAVTNLTWQIY